MLALPVSVRVAGSQSYLTRPELMHVCRHGTNLVGGAALLWEGVPGLQPDRLTRMLRPTGDGVKQLLWRLQHGELPSETQHHPKVVVVHIGTNGESACHSHLFAYMHGILCRLWRLPCLLLLAPGRACMPSAFRTGRHAAASVAQAY